MRCEKCGKEIRISAKNENRFAGKRGYLCDACRKLYPLFLRLTVLPLKNYRCAVLPMFERRYAVNYNYFIWEYNYIWRRCFENPEYIFLFADGLRLDTAALTVLDAISRLWQKHILLLVFYIKK